ncbi:MAG TPA: hypothetical protein VFG55_02345 [Rhodanobacteraceae bacterium]|nr:hypothetical protein [Rhodanobacteraceae bacterium]
MRQPTGIVLLIALLFVGVAPVAARADARADLLAAQQKMMDSRFVIDMNSTSDGETTKMHSEYDTIKRIHAKTPDMELVILPDGTWMRSADGEWQQQPLMSMMVKRFVPMSVEDMKDSITNVEDEGMKQWKGKPARVISWDTETRVLLFKVQSHNRAWIDGNGRIVHTEAESTTRGRKTGVSQDIRYDDSIRVVAPA